MRLVHGLRSLYWLDGLALLPRLGLLPGLARLCGRLAVGRVCLGLGGRHAVAELLVEGGVGEALVGAHVEDGEDAERQGAQDVPAEE